MKPERVAAVVTAILFCCGVSADEPAAAPLPVPSATTQPATRAATRNANDEPYEGFANDLKLLRKTYELSKPRLNASSFEAQAAAARVFKHFPAAGMARERVLKTLGDPSTISDYTKDYRMSDEPNAPIVYRFDNGEGGAEYEIHFVGGRVDHVEVIPLE